MSPARLSMEDMSESELFFEGMWSAQPNKKQKMQPNDDKVDMYDDLEALWETKWKSACKRRQAPFQDASYLDVAPLFASLLQRNITTARSPLYTQAFLTAATALADDVAAALAARTTDATRAAQRLLNACALLRVARVGASSDAAACCPLKQSAYALQKELHMRAARLWATDSPLDEVRIAHVHHHQNQDHYDVNGRLQLAYMKPPPQIPAVVRVPIETLLTGQACPAAVIVSSDRLACTETCERVLARGWAAVVVERPGCGECPVKEGQGEQEQEEGLWKSVLAWMGAMGFYDMDHVVFIGEGEAALRVAATAVGERLRGVVAYLDRETEDEEETAAAAAVVVCETPAPRCPRLVVRERRSWATSNGLWTPVKDEEQQQQQQEGEEEANQHQLNDDGVDDAHDYDLYAFGTEHTACISQLHTTGWMQVYAWVGDLMVGRAGGYFWTVVPAPLEQKVLPGRFVREWTPPSPEGVDVATRVAVCAAVM